MQSMKVIHFLDAATLKRTMRKPIYRPDAAPPSPNPILRFRKEMGHTRDDFAEMLGVPMETLRSWERVGRPIVPTRPKLDELVDLARRNYYPLMVTEIIEYAEQFRNKNGKKALARVIK